MKIFSIAQNCHPAEAELPFYTVSLCFFLYAVDNHRERSFSGHFRPVFNEKKVNDL
jgi:hypothetical protein